MDFFAEQEKARRNTRRLVVLFVLTALGIVAAVNLVVLALLAYPEGVPAETGDWLRGHALVIVWTSLLTLALVGGASAYRTASLRSGGASVAKALGGTPVPPDVEDPLRRQLRNVVEEVSIASGVPVPDIFVLEQEPAINAFAAGYTTSDAAIAVTRGALEQLSRDELQGVVAHEFSHILNGDMRLNMRLLGVLFGVMVVALLGRTLLHGMSRSRVRLGGYGGSRRGGGGEVAAIMGLALALIAIGYIGLLGARLIKAAVSRQREYLADAAAVQFTRYPQGIAGALKKIGGFESGSRLRSVDGEEIGHMLFAHGHRAFAGLFATHPPLVKRIKALEPDFDPREFRTVGASGFAAPANAANHAPRAAAAQPKPAEGIPAFALDPARTAERVGNPHTADIAAAAELRATIPPRVLDAAYSQTEAVYLALALLLSPYDSVREKQVTMIRQGFGPAAAEGAGKFYPWLERLGPAYRLPLLEIAFPALRQQPLERLDRLVALSDRLIAVDGRTRVYEYALSRLLRSQLLEASMPAARRAERRGEGGRSRAVQTLFSVVAHIGHKYQDDAKLAFEAGIGRLMDPAKARYAPPPQWAEPLDSALAELDTLPPAKKRALVEGLVTTALHDGRVLLAELELIRTICTILHCPLPPLHASAPRAE